MFVPERFLQVQGQLVTGLKKNTTTKSPSTITLNMRSETNSARFKHPSRVVSRRTEHTLLVTRYIMLLLSMKINNNFFWFPTKASISMTLIAEGAGHDMALNEDGGERRME